MYPANRLLFALAAVLVLALAGCSNGERTQNDTPGTNEDEGRHLDLTISTMEAVEGSQEITPVVADVPHAPITFAGSDGYTHLVYELETTNFTNGETNIEQLAVYVSTPNLPSNTIALHI